MWAADYALVMYSFGPFSLREINAMDGVLPDLDAALTFGIVSGLGVKYGDWTVDERFGTSTIPETIPVVARNREEGGVTPAYEFSATQSDIILRPTTFEELATCTDLGVSGHKYLEEVLVQLCTSVGDIVRYPLNHNPDKQTLENATRRLEKRNLLLAPGDIVHIAVEVGVQAYAWVVNRAGLRLDCLFFLSDPNEFALHQMGVDLVSAAVGRWKFFAEDWFTDGARVERFAWIDPVLLGEFRKPIFRRTRWEFPSGRYHFVVCYDEVDLWGERYVKRVHQHEVAGIYPDINFTELGVREKLASLQLRRGK